MSERFPESPVTAVVVDEVYLRHDPGSGHPESPRRIQALLQMLRSPGAPRVKRLAPEPADPGEIALNHDRRYIERVAATARRDFYAFDPDTWTCSETYDAARSAVGGVRVLVDAIMAGEVRNGFALVRPPGHHAEYDRAMGFCFFNNVAVAARHLLRQHGLSRILIVDWDLHHGNGTQHSFERDSRVLYVSLHQYPHYPGTGRADEIGRESGEGYTVNIPLPPGCGDEVYLAAFHHLLEPIAAAYRPEFILVSAGFDAHRRDPLGGMELTERGYAAMTARLMTWADGWCSGRLALVLEGGYDRAALTASVDATLRVLNGEATPEVSKLPPWEPRLRATAEALAAFWPVRIPPA